MIPEERMDDIKALVRDAIATREAAQDAELRLNRALDKIKMELAIPASCVFDHCCLRFFERGPGGNLVPIDKGGRGDSSTA